METVKLGTVINVRGLKGELKIASTTNFANERYVKGQKMYLNNHQTGEVTEVTVVKHSTVANFDFVIFEEITTVEKANTFRGFDVEINIEDLKELDEGSYYFFELEGCEVYDDKNEFVGKISEVFDNTRQNIIRIKTEGKDILVPFIKAFIKSVDIENKKVVINMMEGLR